MTPCYAPPALGFTEEHELARQAARRFLAERAPLSGLRSRGPTDFDRSLYREMAELGWLAPEGGGLLRALLLEEMGRVLLPSPYFASLLALLTLDADGPEASAILRGERIATLAHVEPGGAWLPDALTTRSDGQLLHGEKSRVPWGEAAELAVVAAREPGGEVALFCLELPGHGVTVIPEQCVDATRPTARLLLDGARPSARLGGDGRTRLCDALLRGAALLASEMVGAAEALMTMTRDYAIDRKQFGRAIGSFQAVKHPIVDAMIGIELTRNLALGAASLLDSEGFQAPAHMAKAMASDVFSATARKGVQLHGGFGFTWDADVHFFFKRALDSRSSLGDASYHRRALAKLLFD
ncbi:MAG: acyl-CoA dehydrogenase [Myxococcales bacterium]|nr:acyl-CoA dehydrogenase [Myxococcales bacterium]MCB9580673.1 acyl-CoA dehydrogenase [Polyangiaceae bacterium]